MDTILSAIVSFQNSHPEVFGAPQVDGSTDLIVHGKPEWRKCQTQETSYPSTCCLPRIRLWQDYCSFQRNSHSNAGADSTKFWAPLTVKVAWRETFWRVQSMPHQEQIAQKGPTSDILRHLFCLQRFLWITKPFLFCQEWLNSRGLHMRSSPLSITGDLSEITELTQGVTGLLREAVCSKSGTVLDLRQSHTPSTYVS